MEESQIVKDVEAPAPSESMQLDAPLLSEISEPMQLEASQSEISEPMQLEASLRSEAQIAADVEAQIVADVEASMKCELDTLWGNVNEAKNFTIFRTPHNISQSKKNLFKPFVISIGPFHRGKEHLRALEELKWRFLRDFLSQWNHISLNLCISEMKSLEERTRRCYSEKFDDLKSKAFIEMMLLDGCFVLEYNLKFFQGHANYASDVGWNHNFIEFDLLLLENQIPFFIVDKLYDLIGNNQDCFVKYIAHRFLWRVETKQIHWNCRKHIMPDLPAEIHHLVHLCYHYLVPNPEKPVVLSSKLFDLIKGLLHRFGSRPVQSGRSPHSTSRSSSVPFPNSTGDISSMVIPCATELKQKGLKFRQQIDPRHMLDISFEYGVLKIPRLKITDSTRPIFANLLAFEHSKYGNKHSPFGRFLSFLDKLVNTTNDVIILQESGIIENWLGNEEELAHFLN